MKEESELETELEGWLFVLKNMSRLERMPLYLRKPIFEKLFDIAEYSKLTTEEREMYNTSLTKKWDTANALAYARQEGEEAKSYEFVSNLILAHRFTTAEIANFAAVTEEFVEKVRADLDKKKK